MLSSRSHPPSSFIHIPQIIHQNQTEIQPQHHITTTANPLPSSPITHISPTKKNNTFSPKKKKNHRTLHSNFIFFTLLVMAIYHQYQPPHQMHSIFAKFDRLLDMMESRMDVVDRRVENLRQKQYSSPHQSGRSSNIPDGFFSRHPEDAANRCVGYPRAPPLPEPPQHRTSSSSSVQRTRRCYLPHSHPPASRSNYSYFTAGKNAHQPPPDAFTAGDQFREQEVRRIPNPGKFLPESHRQ